MEHQTRLSEPPPSSRGNMTTLVKPPKPEARPCATGCGVFIEPFFIEPITVFDRLAMFSNRWEFGANRCPACLELVAKAEAEKEADRRRIKLDSELEEMILSKGVAEFTFARFRISQGTSVALEACRAFNPKNDNLYLWGSAGCGKTHLAVATLRRFHSEGMSAEFLKHAALNRTMQGLKSDEYEEKLDEYTDRSVLVIDDLGTAKQTEYADQVLYEIIDTRMMKYQNGLIITSNLSLGDLAKKFGDDRLPSRISGFCKAIKLDGTDWRVNRERMAQHVQ